METDCGEKWQVKINVTLPYGDKLWIWPARKYLIFYLMINIVKIIKPPEGKNVG